MSTPRPDKASEQGTKSPQSEVLKDLKEVGAGAAVLYGLIGVVLLGSQPAAVHLLTSPGQLNGPAVEFYLNVFRQAAPLTLAVAVVGVLWAWGLRQPLDSSSAVGLLVVFPALILIVSIALGNRLAAGRHVEARRLVGDWPFELGVLINSLYSYYGAYRGVLFWSSVLVGGYLAVVWVWKVEPFLRARSLRRQAAEAGGSAPGVKKDKAA